MSKPEYTHQCRYCAYCVFTIDDNYWCDIDGADDFGCGTMNEQEEDET